MRVVCLRQRAARRSVRARWGSVPRSCLERAAGSLAGRCRAGPRRARACGGEADGELKVSSRRPRRTTQTVLAGPGPRWRARSALSGAIGRSPRLISPRQVGVGHAAVRPGLPGDAGRGPGRAGPAPLGASRCAARGVGAEPASLPQTARVLEEKSTNVSASGAELVEEPGADGLRPGHARQLGRVEVGHGPVVAPARCITAADPPRPAAPVTRPGSVSPARSVTSQAAKASPAPRAACLAASSACRGACPPRPADQDSEVLSVVPVRARCRADVAAEGAGAACHCNRAVPRHGSRRRGGAPTRAAGRGSRCRAAIWRPSSPGAREAKSVRARQDGSGELLRQVDGGRPCAAGRPSPITRPGAHTMACAGSAGSVSSTATRRTTSHVGASTPASPRAWWRVRTAVTARRSSGRWGPVPLEGPVVPVVPGGPGGPGGGDPGGLVRVQGRQGRSPL